MDNKKYQNNAQKVLEMANENVTTFFNYFESDKHIELEQEDFKLLYKLVENTINQALNKKLIDLTLQTNQSGLPKHIQILRAVYKKTFKAINELEIE